MFSVLYCFLFSVGANLFYCFFFMFSFAVVFCGCGLVFLSFFMKLWMRFSFSLMLHEIVSAESTARVGVSLAKLRNTRSRVWKESHICCFCVRSKYVLCRCNFVMVYFSLEGKNFDKAVAVG